MAHINENYDKLPGSYLFAAIARKVAEFQAKNPNAKVIRLGIGDVTQPLVPAVIEALHKATDEMANSATFRGYGPEQGYDFLRNAIIASDYTTRNVKLDADEVFVSDGSKCDVANIQELFDVDCKVAISDPVYPVYLDSNVMAGRTGYKQESGYFDGITYLSANPENNFAPALPETPVDLIYLCSPNNPTGTVLSHDELAKWVAYAKETGAVILFDSAYTAYMRDPKLPQTIYEVPGAKEVAIEFKSFSKSAGFTGLRCAYTVVPKELQIKDSKGNVCSLNAMWNRRQCTKFNGVSYIVQRAAEAACSAEGKAQQSAIIDYYMENAKIIRDGLISSGYEVYGCEHAPYLWWKLPLGLDSMSFADILLERCQVVGTPGVGFGPGGEGFFRLTAFGNREQTIEAVERIKNTKLD